MRRFSRSLFIFKANTACPPVFMAFESGFYVAARAEHRQIWCQEESWFSSCRVTGVSSLNSGRTSVRPFFYLFNIDTTSEFV
jgi:hypothetical protein